MRLGVLTLQAACGLALATYPLDAHAYIDVATGSLLLQIAIAGIAGAAFIAKLYWHKLKGFVTGKRADEPERNPEDTGTGLAESAPDRD